MSRNKFPWRTAARIAWRESRASTVKFTFVILAVAAGVGSLAGVRGFSRTFRDMLLRDARTLMAGDLSVRVFELPTDEQTAEFDSLEQRGAQRTWLTETVSMVGTAKSESPVLVSVKAVDPALYPFYGELKLSTGATLREALKPDTVAASEDLLSKAALSVGDSIRMGGADFRVAALITSEPDRMAGSLNVGPRVLLSRDALARTGLLKAGSRAAQRFLFKLPKTLDVGQVRDELKGVFKQAVIADYRETHPLITRGLDRATMFLSLVSLIALIVGALGVAMAMHSHLQQKMDSIAVMKSIGARSGQIILIYSLQALMLALAGTLLGIVAGIGVERVFPALIAKFFPVTPEVHWHPISFLESLGIGVLTTMLFTVPPLLSIRRIRPSLILRREMAELRLGSRWRDLGPGLLTGLLIALALAGIATWLVHGLIGTSLTDALRVGGYFVGGLLASLLALAVFAWALLRGLKWFVRSRKLPSSLRHGIANLYRPGNQAAAVLVALGLGVTFTLSIYLLQHSVLAQVARSSPPTMPNVFLVNITARDLDPIKSFLAAQPGVKAKPEIFASIGGKVEAIDGVTIDEKSLTGPARRFRGPRQMQPVATRPENTEVIAGAWWTKTDPADLQVAVSEEASKLLPIRVGSVIDWTVSGHQLRTRVAAITRTEAVRATSNIEFFVTPETLTGVPFLYFGGVRVESAQIGKLQRAFYEKYPAVTVINVADVLERVQEVVDQIAIVVRFISGFAILAGAIILAASVAGTRFRRIREVVTLKTLGATRQRIARIFSVEFLILGFVAGVMGSVLATGFSMLILKRLLDSEFRFDPIPNIAAVLLTALIANAAGWLASFRILGQKPLEILRNE